RHAIALQQVGDLLGGTHMADGHALLAGQPSLMQADATAGGDPQTAGGQCDDAAARGAIAAHQGGDALAVDEPADRFGRVGVATRRDQLKNDTLVSFAALDAPPESVLEFNLVVLD